LEGDAAILLDLQQVTLGEYEILGVLGKGGMGLVFLANDLSLNRKVAIKVLPPEMLQGEASVERFRREARIAASLRHRNITSVFGLKETTRVVFFIMEFVQGGTLHGLLHAVGRLEIDSAEAVLHDAASALTYAHRRDVVHRDLKPSNLLIDVEGIVLVTDFGVAKLSGSQGLTTTGSAIGSPKYMSPEQWSGKATTASDQYSLGCVAYEILTGRAPFEGESLQELLKQHLMDAPVHLNEYRPDCPARIATAVMRMLEKEPSNRFPTVEAAIAAMGIQPVSADAPVRRSLARFAAEGDKIRPLPKTPKSPIPIQSSKHSAKPAATAASVGRRSLWIGASAMAVIAVGGVSAYLYFTTPGSSPPRKPDSAAGDAVLQSASPHKDTVKPAAQSSDGTSRSGAAASASPTLFTLEVLPRNPRLVSGKAVQLSAVLDDAKGSRVSQRSVQWSSSDPGIAIVSRAGTVTANRPGSAVITAEVNGRTANASVTVVEPTASRVLTQIEIGPPRLSVEVNASHTLRVSGTDTKGRPLDARRVQWASENPGIAAVSSSGTVIGVSRGTASITASVDGMTSAPVEVNVIEPPRTVGVLRMLIAPWANVSIDGDVKGQRTRGEDTLTSNVEHRIRFERNGFAPIDTTIVLKTNEQRLLRIILLQRAP
jgi:serine/threonine-protein kinase